ncbi:related to multidrug resistant protein [Cephalotrichum gorgonifer]|uniref:Related to multidrug resistant protein n=1 Tax=Cephalotrichum gorgonifer TaxID=2041049 RepID=A0AAE8SZR8_9PEZI|nr:related to multidrug resistant protein [Cephalotrichum gorgonifer]
MPPNSNLENDHPNGHILWDESPDNPHNWTTPKKTLNLGIVSLLAFLTPLESSVIVPGVPLLRNEFHETRRPVTSLVVSIFVLGFAFGPLLLSPLSELYGRRLLFNISNVATLIFSIASAAAPNIASFVVFRFIAGSFGAGPMNIGGGSIADQIPPVKRGFAMSIFFTGIFLGPVIGPVMGGFVAKYLGWRWVFWLISIVKGVMTIVTFFFLSESHSPTIQHRKARLAKQLYPSTPLKSSSGTNSTLLRSVTRPMRMLILSPIVTGLSLYLALIYGYLYLLFTTFSTVFAEQYGFGTDILGLAFLGLGVGFGLFVYGWTVQYEIHWIVPIIFTSLTGVGLIFSFLPTKIYMVDAFTEYAASALAATSVVRSIVGGCLPIAGLPLYSALGYGWGNSLLGFIAILASVAPLLFWRYGEILRKKYEVKFD